MTLTSGTRLGPYEVLAPIGAGGMGEVYRARDMRLGRAVALKILPAEFAANAQLRSRFEREARTVSKLNHPHICMLFDVGENYLVMELLEGESLAARVARGPLPIADTLKYAVQIAEALGKAHREGIVHRDLKPGNVMLTKSGAKLLDFGLAKQTGFAATENSTAATAEQPLTHEGTIVGTFQYMAPEQLAGEEPDARTDIFALGAVLYEMATGRRAFEGQTKTSLVTAIMSADPKPMAELQPLTPPALEHIVRKCLAKERDDRWQSVTDVAEELRWIRESESGSAARVVSRPRGRRLGGFFAAAVVLVCATAAVTLWLRERSRLPIVAVSSPLTRATIDLRGGAPLALGTFTPELGYFGTVVSLSPDGSQVIYVGWSEGDTQLFKRRLDREEIEPIRGTRGVREAFFSPDGGSIAVITSDKLIQVPLDETPPVVLGSLIRSATRGVWRNRDAIYIGDDEGAIVVHFNGRGDKVIDADLNELALGERVRFSDILPDGSGAIVNVSTAVAMSGDYSRIALLDLKTKKLIPLLDRGYDGHYVEPGILTFIRGGDLLAIRFDARKRTVAGEPVLIASGIATDSFLRRSQYAVSPDGSLAYVPGSDRSRGRIAVIDRSGTQSFLNVPSQLYVRLDLSPDDRFLATHVSDVNDFLWIFDLVHQEGKRLTLPDSAGDPLWRRDGNALYALVGSGPGGLSLTELDPAGGRPPHEIGPINSKYAYLLANLPDGGVIMSRSAGDVVVCREDAPLATVTHLRTLTADVSPDGKWIAFGERGGIFIGPISAPDRRTQISTGAGIEPVWCRACPEVFYRNGDRWYSVHVSTDGGLRADPPREVWRTSFIDTFGRSYDVSRDGRRLFVSKRTEADITDQIRLVRNWPALLAARREAPGAAATR